MDTTTDSSLDTKRLGDLFINPMITPKDKKLSLDQGSIKSVDPQASKDGKIYRKSYLIGKMEVVIESLANAINNGEWGKAEAMVRKLEEKGILKEVPETVGDK